MNIFPSTQCSHYLPMAELYCDNASMSCPAPNSEFPRSKNFLASALDFDSASEIDYEYHHMVA